jgi:nucleotide-binding universal stress UspA family protein
MGAGRREPAGGSAEESRAGSAGESERSGAGVELPTTVLVPTDFSPCGLAAIPYAYALVAAGGAVHLLHVMAPEEVPNPLYAHYSPGHAATPEVRARQEAELRARLETLAPPAARAREVRTVARVVEADDVAELVCAAAEQLDVDAICLGTHGRAGLTRALLGSVALRVLEHSRRQVLLIRPRSA